jgi:hypothetical protein
VAGFVLLHDFSANPSALGDMQSVLLGPGPDEGPVDPRASCPDGTRPPAAADPPGRLDIGPQGFLELAPVLFAEVYFIADAVETEGDGFGAVRAIQIVADNDMYVSCHARDNGDVLDICQIGHRPDQLGD